MSKSITLNGVDYTYYLAAGKLYRWKATNIGNVQSVVKSGSTEFNRVVTAICGY